MWELRREFTDAIRKERIDEIIMGRRIKMLRESERLLQIQRGEEDPDAPPASLFKENPKVYFETIKKTMEKHVTGRPNSQALMRLLSVIRDKSTSATFPVQTLMDTDLAAYLLRLATADECDLQLNEFALA